jgi:hypothetical protein
VHQTRRLERLARRLAGEPPGGELAQLIVDPREELTGRLLVALFDRREDAGDVVHRGHSSRPAPSLHPVRQRESVPPQA